MEAVTSQKKAVSPFLRSGSLPSRSQKSWPRLAGNSQAARHLEEVISRVAPFDCPVLITGETGCGKEEVARAIHAASPRRDGPFVSINCGGLVASLAESHFFGHEKGAFTGAVGASLGGFRSANGGVVFLDEIGEMPLELQPKLLQVLQRWEVAPVGSTKSYPIDVQVIAATNRDLESQIDQGLFRDDLFYRLNTVHISIPPLRSRTADIPGFIDHFSAHFAKKYGRPQWQPEAGLLERLLAHPWPGNVRQLAQTIQRLYVFEDRRAWVLKQLLQDDAQEDADVAAPIQADSLPAASPAPLAEPTAADLLGVSLNTMTRMVAESCPDLAPKGGRKPAAKPR